MNKKITIVIIAVVIVLLGCVGVYLITKSSNDFESSQDSDPPAPIEQPIPEGLTPPAREASYEYTDTVISPNSIANDPDAYTGTTISTRGWVTEIGPGEYLILSINSDEPFGLQLATNENIDFKNYVDPSPDPLKESKPVTLTGELVISETTGTLVFLIASLTE